MEILIFVSHKNIIQYCNRPFDNIEEMNKTIIKNWNDIVSKNDTVFMLGDFALCGKDKIVEIGQKLNGKKTLVLGNHDRASLNTYYQAGFEYVSKYPIIFNDFFILSHEPQHISGNGLYANIFAHIHDNPIFSTVTPRSFCVSVERINYTPISFEKVLNKMKVSEARGE